MITGSKYTYPLPPDNLRFEDTDTPPTPGAVVPCLVCMKPFVMRPFIGAPDQICRECAATYLDTARVVCVRCVPPVTICRIAPGVLANGYVVKPRALLHSDKCNICCPNLTESSILEIAAWERTLRPGKTISIAKK